MQPSISQLLVPKNEGLAEGASLRPRQQEYTQNQLALMEQYQRGAPMHYLQSGSYNSQPNMPPISQLLVSKDDVFDEVAFSKAFETARSELQDQEASLGQTDVLDHAQPTETSYQSEHNPNYRIGADRIIDESEQRQGSLSHEEGADELARTAGQLLENLKYDQSTKFQGSNFLSLMRQLRDREVKLDGETFVEAKQPLHPGGPGYPDIIYHQNGEKDATHPRPAPNKLRASSVPRHRPKGSELEDLQRPSLSPWPYDPSDHLDGLTETRDSSDGSSVSGKHSFRTSIFPCGDQDDCTSENAPNSLSTSPSNEPPPFSAHNFSPGLSPNRPPSPITEPDYPPPPPFAPAPLDCQQTPSASEVEVETKAALAAKNEGESSSKSAEESEPPPPYTEGSSPLGSFTYVMAAAGGPASIITQVSPGGPSQPSGGHSFADVGPDENISLDLRGTKFSLSRDELLTLPEFVLLSLFPNGLLPDGHMGQFHDVDTYPVDYDPASLQYMLDFFRTVAQTIPSTSPSPVTDTPSTETAAPGSAKEMLQDRVGIIVLREDLDFYAIPPRAEIDQSEMIEVKRAAGRALLRQDGIFSGLRKSEEAGTTEQHLIEMLTAGGFYNDDRWGHRASEPNKAVICSLALARLRTDIKGNDLANNNALLMAHKLLLFWRKPARRCWWEGVELDDVEGIDGNKKSLPVASIESFRGHTRRLFRQNVNIRGKAKVCAALKAGYQTLEDLSIRKSSILEQLSKLSGASQNAPQDRAERKETGGPSPIKPGLKKSQPDTGRRWPYPGAQRVLDGLPSPPPGKTRKVPTMVNANHIPFLRFKKPQSPFLSHMIRKKTIEREKRVDKMQDLQQALIWAEDEDQWESFLEEINGVYGNDDGTQWASAIRDSLSHVRRVHVRNTVKRMHSAERMFEVLEEQKKLADRERLERRDQRHKIYKERRRQIKERGEVATHQPAHHDGTRLASAASM
ncbi:MAG: hypothetical protein Q9220_003440 [cf. Caloplaca sp. 1 TL-2023]